MIIKPIFKSTMFPLLAFLIPLAVRAVPEILMGPYIVGFDPLGYYIPIVLRWLSEGVNFWEYIATAPLFYTVLMGLASLGIPLTLSLKVIPPLMHGFLSLAIYFYAINASAWSYKKSLLAAFLPTLYFVGLRISWDLLRNELGLALMFVTLTLLRKNQKQWKHYVGLLLAMVLVVLAHQLVSVTMFVIIAVTILRALLNDRVGDAMSLVVASIPAMLLFLSIVYASYVMSTGFSLFMGYITKNGEGWFSLFGFASYRDMVVNMLGLLLYCFLPLLPLVIMGARKLKDLNIKSWVGWSLVAIVIPIVSPNMSILGWDRWIMMLVYPFAFYAVEALVRLKVNMQLTFGLFLVTLTIGFVLVPNESAFPYYVLFPCYVPSSMLQNTVPLSACQGTVNSLLWLKDNMNNGARLLTHIAFHGWALQVLGDDQIIMYGFESPEKVALKALQEGYNQLYLIWWTDGNGWHGQPSVAQCFKEVYRSGEIAIYIYAKAK